MVGQGPLRVRAASPTLSSQAAATGSSSRCQVMTHMGSLPPQGLAGMGSRRLQGLPAVAKRLV